MQHQYVFDSQAGSPMIYTDEVLLAARLIVDQEGQGSSPSVGTNIVCLHSVQSV